MYEYGIKKAFTILSLILWTSIYMQVRTWFSSVINSGPPGPLTTKLLQNIVTDSFNLIKLLGCS